MSKSKGENCGQRSRLKFLEYQRTYLTSLKAWYWPDDSLSMIGAKHQHELMEEELSRSLKTFLGRITLMKAKSPSTITAKNAKKFPTALFNFSTTTKHHKVATEPIVVYVSQTDTEVIQKL